MRRDHFYVYIITNKKNGVLYIGITNDLERRLWEHKNKLNNSFSKKYNLLKLLYYEVYKDSGQAITREKQLKNWHREWKFNLIKQNNPNFEDLSIEWDCFRDPETSSG